MLWLGQSHAETSGGWLTKETLDLRAGDAIAVSCWQNLGHNYRIDSQLQAMLNFYIVNALLLQLQYLCNVVA